MWWCAVTNGRGVFMKIISMSMSLFLFSRFTKLPISYRISGWIFAIEKLETEIPKLLLAKDSWRYQLGNVLIAFSQLRSWLSRCSIYLRLSIHVKCDWCFDCTYLALSLSLSMCSMALHAYLCLCMHAVRTATATLLSILRNMPYPIWFVLNSCRVAGSA